MEYKIIVITPDGNEHPEIPVDNLDEALQTARTSLERGYLRSPKVVVALGPGTLIRVMSDQELSSLTQRKSAFPVDLERRWKLIIHHGHVTVPLNYDEEYILHAAVDEAMEKGYLFHQIKEDHDYLYVKQQPGTVFLMVSTEEFKTRQRQALEAQMRAHQQQPKQMAEDAPKIVVPGKIN